MNSFALIISRILFAHLIRSIQPNMFLCRRKECSECHERTGWVTQKNPLPLRDIHAAVVLFDDTNVLHPEVYNQMTSFLDEWRHFLIKGWK